VRIKQRMRDYKLYRLAQEIKWTVEKYWQNGGDGNPRVKVVSLKPPGPSRGDILLSRVNEAFLLKPGEPIPMSHQNYWEAYQQAMVFLDLGYGVDVIHFQNREFVPQKDYILFCDAAWNMERIAPLLYKKCVKLAHLLTADPLFNNTAELKRLMALQERRGVNLVPRRQIWQPFHAMDYADCATLLGHEFTLNTFRHTRKPLYPVPAATPLLYPWPETKDFEASRNSFVWFGGGGMVHKGLDLVLEAFASMPAYHLFVCGPVEKEQDFVAAYHRELYETENIELVGWVDVSSPKFLEIARNCVGLIHPSCSEGSSTAVVACMHAGLIPIISYESSVDVSPDCGIVLMKSSIEEIQDAVRSIGGLPAATLREMARHTWERARAEHSPECFFEEYSRVVSQLIAGRADPAPASTIQVKNGSPPTA
jgi:glycosyltransferase involved in cell wall biosynthesis